MSEQQLVKLNKIGQGSYGAVYSAKTIDQGEENEDEDVCAVKRNFKEPSTTGYSTLRELNMMIALTGHPYIVNLKCVKDQDPFKGTSNPMTPVKRMKDFKNMVEDKMHFVMEYLPFNGEEFIMQPECTPEAMKVIIMQFLLAIEYIHSQGIVHRDIRTSNILISVDDDGNHKLVLCDFGLSRIMGDGHYTKGVVTSWYRAPEICCECPYDKKIDIWSAGCVIYEIVCKRPLLKGVDDEDTELFNAILTKLPIAPERKVINKLFNRGKKLKLGDYTKYNRKKFIERMVLNNATKKSFNKTPGNLDELEDLLEQMLTLDPDIRISATRSLNHPFFEWTRDHIKEIREEYKPEPPPLPYYEINPCIERTWVFSLVYNIYNKYIRDNKIDVKPISVKDLPKVEDIYIPPDYTDWFSYRNIFHAVDLFDQYIEYCLTSDKIKLRKKETSLLGRIHSKEETYLRFYACIYQIYKYNCTLEITLKWEDIVPSIFATSKSMKDRETFEKLMVYDVTKMMTYRKTLLEISTDYVKELEDSDIRTLLEKLGYLTEPWTEKSVRALFRQFMNIQPSSSPK